MKTVLEKICETKLTHIERRKVQTPLSKLKVELEENLLSHGFINSLLDHKIAIITEVKKASPSKGIIRHDFDPVAIAKTYEQAGAACLSVLTDEPYFQGRDSYLQDIRKAVSLPLLRKDFMIDPYQIYESRALGADCVLLIMAALDDERAKDLYDLATGLSMDVLVEIHDEEELERALKLDPRMIGVNNRNLKTLEVSLETGLKLAEKIPDNVLKVAESGIETPEHIKTFLSAGYQAFLVGESLMRQDDIAAAVKNLLSAS